MSYYSDVTILAGKKAYKILERAWKKDGLEPSLQKSIVKNEFVFIQFRHVEKIPHTELYNALAGFEFCYNIEDRDCAMKAIVLHDSKTGNQFSNDEGEKLFADFDTDVCFVLPREIGEELKDVISVVPVDAGMFSV